MKAEKVTKLEGITQWRVFSVVTYNYHQILLVHSNEGERYELNV